MKIFIVLTRYFFTVVSLMSLLLACRKDASAPAVPHQVSTETSIPAPLPLAVSFRLNKAFGGYYISLPESYTQSDKDYPVLIFLHGAGQTGNGSSDLQYLLNDGIGKLLYHKQLPASFVWADKSYSFIIASPQYSHVPDSMEMEQLVEYFTTTYRIDKKRIYLAGLSQGARIVTLAAARTPLTFAAVVAIAGVAPNAGMEARCDSIARNNLPIWAFHNLDDPMADVHVTEQFIELISGFASRVQPRLTIFDVYGHDAWTTALDPNYKEEGKNIYEWMLQYSR